MTTPTNWPNPERPGVPMFPEYVGEHILTELLSGKEVHALWNNEQSCWDVVALYEQTPKTVAQYFHYVRCKRVILTPAQMAEMLAGERERVEAEMGAYVKNIMDAHPEWNMEQLHSALKEREAIRNLGDAP